MNCPEDCSPGTCQDGDKLPYSCGGGRQVPWCTCRSQRNCTPSCLNTGSEKQWFDPCKKESPKKAKCQGCNAICQKMGTPEEGWYSSCDGALIWKSRCAPRWACTAGAPQKCPDTSTTCVKSGGFCAPPGQTCGSPYQKQSSPQGCQGSSAICCGPTKRCLKAGSSFIDIQNDGVCCPGTRKLSYSKPFYDKTTQAFSCLRTRTPTSICVICGDGVCGADENFCVCPSDCPKPQAPKLPKPCNNDSDCKNEPKKFCGQQGRCDADCRQDTDCPGKQSCQQRGSSCEQRRYVCTLGRCQEMTSILSQGTCEPSGRCR